MCLPQGNDSVFRQQSISDHEVFADIKLLHNAILAPTNLKVQLVDLSADLDELFLSIETLAVKW